jgi:hypothetical protein
MTDEQRLQMITEQLILVRDNLFRGMSKSMQKLQARSINEVLELPNHTQSLQRTWTGLTDEDFLEACQIAERGNYLVAFQRIQAALKAKNT